MVQSETTNLDTTETRTFISRKELVLTNARCRRKANLLDLADICIIKILKYLDYKSHFHVLLTSKQLYAIGSITQLENDKVLQQKTIHLLHRWCREFAECYTDDELKLQSDSVYRILTSAKKLSLRVHVVNVKKIKTIWLNCCPVAAKLFSFIVDYRVCHSRAVDLDPRPSCFSEKTTCTFQLPVGKHLQITWYRYIDGGEVFLDKRNVMSIIKSDNIVDKLNRNTSCLHCGEDEKSLASIISILQNELGQTSQPLTEHFLTEFLLEYLQSLDVYSFPEQLKLYFKDQPKNHITAINSLFATMAGTRNLFFKEFWSEERHIISQAKKEHLEFCNEFVECILGIATRLGPKAIDLLLLAFKCLKLMMKNKIGYNDSYDKLLRRVDFFSIIGGFEVIGPPFNIISGEIRLRLDKGKVLKCLGKLHCSAEGTYFLTIPEIVFLLPDGGTEKLAIRPCPVRGIVPAGNVKFVSELLKDCMDCDNAKDLESGLGYFFYLLLDCVCWNVQWVFQNRT